MKIVVAMSGGVDSSVAALLLKRQGHELIGISMKLSDAPASPGTKSSGCCSVEDLTDARRVCDSLEIPYYAVNFKEHFKEKVIQPFVAEYLKGRTPNPCVLCNSELKFDLFLEKAAQLGADAVATGHYAQIVYDEKEKKYRLYRGRDPKKDQSYFLYGLKQKDLGKILFPVGHLTKEEVRAIAREANLKTKDKAESQEICFVPNDDPGAFIESYPGVKTQEGDFVDEEGQVLGKHLGVHRYTLGQRRGTQVSSGKRLYVNGIDIESNKITLSSEQALYHRSLLASEVTWISQTPKEGEWFEAKIRYRVNPSACQLRILENNHVQLHFKEAQRAITPGQALVFYQGEEVLGGGWIERAF